MTQNPVCNEETPPAPPAPSPQASHPQRFSAVIAKGTLQNGVKSDDDNFCHFESHLTPRAPLKKVTKLHYPIECVAESHFPKKLSTLADLQLLWVIISGMEHF